MGKTLKNFHQWHEKKKKESKMVRWSYLCSVVRKSIKNTASVALRETDSLRAGVALEGLCFVGYCKVARGRIRRKMEARDVGKRGSSCTW